MIRRPLLAIPAISCTMAGAICAVAAIACSASGHLPWALGIGAGWLAGCLNSLLLARRVSTLTSRSRVFGFLYGMASRFALIALMFLGALRLVPASPVGFA
ncbi:MAG TPA: ATP synthase subunit I, partial [Candidatus Dormibacteraeota bacterium]|nr:ATP synthase subunit I [Candidatus Dormibacteraeota bacterium]